MTNKPCIIVAAVLLSGVAGLAGADTVYFSDGTTLDGKVTQPNANCYAIESGNGTMLVQVTRVSKVEKNDKAGTIDLARTNPKTIEFLEGMKKKTGVSAAKREEIVSTIDKLASEDANEREAARHRLVAMQREMDMFAFLANTLESYGARLLPGVLQVLMEIDPAKAKPIVRACATDQVASNRAAALQIMGSSKSVASLDTIARGMVDSEESVRIAAAGALAMTGDKRATPVLLDGLQNVDRRVSNACNTALAKLWSDKNSVVQFSSPEDWGRFWSDHAGNVADPITTASLKPLFVPEPGSYVIVHE